VKQLRSVRDENTPVRSLRSASTSEVGKKIVFSDRELVLPPLKDNDSLTVQLETVRLNGVCTKNMIETSLKWSSNYERKLVTVVRIMKF
jgi:hypothetical protein